MSTKSTAMSVVERTKEALRRLGTPSCSKCKKLMPDTPGSMCDECKAAEIRENARRNQSVLERDVAEIEGTFRSSSAEYRMAVSEHGDLIMEAMDDWQIGSGIVGRRGRD